MNTTSLITYIRDIKNSDLSDAERRRLIGDYLENRARKLCIPIHGYFELTSNCNFDCKMCYVHSQHNQQINSHNLSTDEWISIISAAIKSGMRWATLTGGECLTHSGFYDIYKYCIESKLQTSILTNGFLLNDSIVDLLKAHVPNMIQISLYGSNNDAYERVTGHRAFDTVINNIKMLQHESLPVRIAITPNAAMADDLEPLIDLVNQLGVRYDINCKLSTPRENVENQVEDITIEQYINLFKQRFKYEGKSLYVNNPNDLPEENHIGHERRGIGCGAGQSTFSVDSKGNLMPCTSLSEYRVSIYEKGFDAAWAAINDYAHSYMTPGECLDCAYYPICVHCVALHKNAVPGHCDKSICERTKRLAEAGFYKLKDT